MQTEDYIYQDDLSQNRYPLSKKHVLAVSLTAFLASGLYFTLPTNPSSLLPGESKDESLASQKQNAYEEIIDPTRSLTDVLLDRNDEVPATSRDVTASSNNNNQEVFTRSDSDALENFDDGEVDTTLAENDESLLEDHLNAMVDQEPDTTQPAIPEPVWTSDEVQKGDTLSSIFSDMNIPYAVLQSLTRIKEVESNITSLRPGNKLYFAFDTKNNLTEFVKPINSFEQWHFSRTNVEENTFSVIKERLNAHLVTDENAEGEVELGKIPAYKTRGRLVVVHINQGDSFSGAAHDAGLTYQEIRRITELFRGRVQFTRHLQAGDTIRVLFSDDQGEGVINAVELQLKRLGRLASYRNEVDDCFYDERGYNSSSSTFRRFPIDGKVIISSPFNPNRRHPVTGKIRPHNGTDFAVRVGTPVVAPADGVVELARYSRSAGYYIILRHRGHYSTVYMHLSKLNVKVGQRVRIGQVIARSGNTGISTGPHLHYELRLNNKPINAMKVSLPANTDVAIAQKNKEIFDRNVRLFKKELYQEDLIAQKK